VCARERWRNGVRLRRAGLLTTALLVWRATALPSHSQLTPTGLHEGGGPVMWCPAPSHRRLRPHGATPLTRHSGQCVDGTYFLFTWCPRDGWDLPLASDDFLHWSCYRGDTQDGMLCPVCPGIGTPAVDHWAGRADEGHVYWAYQELCGNCRVGFCTAAADRTWLCQVCDSPNRGAR
jgi:hypothetical protein